MNNTNIRNFTSLLPVGQSDVTFWYWAQNSIAVGRQATDFCVPLFMATLFLLFLSPYEPELVTEHAGTLRSGSSHNVICLTQNLEPHIRTQEHAHTLLERWRLCFLSFLSSLSTLRPLYNPKIHTQKQTCTHARTHTHTHTFLHIVKNRPSNIKRISDLRESPFRRDERQKGTETSKLAGR